MHISRIRVTNYRCLKQVDAPLSRFTTLIGENNCGKSSLLQALILLIRGTKLSSANFYDPTADVIIDAVFDGLSDADLGNLAEEHRDRIGQMVINGTLRLIRRYKTDGSSELRCVRKVPGEDRFKDEVITGNLKGLSGAELREKVQAVYPELLDALPTITNQTIAKQLISRLVNNLPPDSMEDKEADLPTGIENSVKALLPEPVYIPAVKDLTDDVKTKENTSFGRLLSILLGTIEPKLNEAQETFATLNEKLNRVRQEGEVVDNRLDEIRLVESTIQAYVQESFPSVSLCIDIPQPEVKTILSGARITVNDGVEGLIDTKGDGLKRAVTFSILRSYVTLSARPEWQKESTKAHSSAEHYLFLFEEPELYLYPTAQMILFDALRRVAEGHQVVISTHSPLFLTPFAVGTFAKIVKKPASESACPPCADIVPIDLSDASTRDQFQLICYDNNSAAFFADSVVLVEGDSDHICLEHIAKTLNSDWDFRRTKTALIRINGKGNIARYREFFGRFNTRTYVVVDLDVLIRGFDKLGLPEHINRRRTELLQIVDRIVDTNDCTTKPRGEEVKEIVRRMDWREQWASFKEMAKKCKDGGTLSQEDLRTLDQLLEPEKTQPRLAVLREHPRILDQKRALLRAAREHGVFILEKGSIEDYYPSDVSGGDKPTRAQSFCKRVTEAAEIRKLCHCVPADDGTETSEFDLIFESIFCGL